ncbi:MAG: hypothetical protein HYV16_16785 [Gammaproteobacteria bacterium]|nr:hypothetical protein [Gammaproteobacteria bacterium]
METVLSTFSLSSKTIVLGILLLVVLPVAIAAGAMLMTERGIVSNALYVVAGISALTFLPFLYLINNNAVTISDGSLTVKAGFYSRTVSLEKVDAAQIRQVDTINEPSLALSMRINGIGMPNYSSGWFKIKNGDTVFVLMGNPPYVYIPIKGSEAFIISAPSTAEFINSLKAAKE